MYLHCPTCQATVTAARLIGPDRLCPHCGTPAVYPLSFFSSMPSRYLRRRRPPQPRAPRRPSRFAATERRSTPRVAHR